MINSKDSVYKISYVNDKKIIEIGNDKYYCVNKSEIYKYLESINYYYDYIDSDSEYLFCKYLENDLDKKSNLEEMIKNLSLLHTKSTCYIDLDEVERQEIYDSNLEYLDNVMKYYLDLQDGIEEMDYIRTDYFLLLINISKIYKLINYSIFYLNKWFDLKVNKYREVLLINNFNNNYTFKDNGYFIDFSNSYRGYFINDLVLLYKNNLSEFNDLLELYNLRYHIESFDYYLFFSLIGKVSKIRFSKNISLNISTIRNLIDYVDFSLEFLEKNKDSQETD